MTQAPIKTISVHTLKQLRDENPALCLIDVRELHEWNTLHIPGALHIPKDDLSESINAVISDKSQIVYLHCRSGVRSLYAAQCLMELGYQDVYSVDGGINEWAMSGYPVEE